jgi:hypothetical protein
MIKHFLKLKFKNINTAFDPISYAASLEGYSFAEIVCLQAIKSAVIERRKEVRELDFWRTSQMRSAATGRAKLRVKAIVVSTEPISRIRSRRSRAA